MGICASSKKNKKALAKSKINKFALEDEKNEELTNPESGNGQNKNSTAGTDGTGTNHLQSATGNGEGSLHTNGVGRRPANRIKDPTKLFRDPETVSDDYIKKSYSFLKVIEYSKSKLIKIQVLI